MTRSCTSVLRLKSGPKIASPIALTTSMSKPWIRLVCVLRAAIRKVSADTPTLRIPSSRIRATVLPDSTVPSAGSDSSVAGSVLQSDAGAGVYAGSAAGSGTGVSS